MSTHKKNWTSREDLRSLCLYGQVGSTCSNWWEIVKLFIFDTKWAIWRPALATLCFRWGPVWPAELSCFYHCDKHLKHLPGIKGLFLLAISKDLIHGQVGLWTAFGGQWWSTITPLGARLWKKARRRNLGPTMPPRHVTNNSESTSKAHCCGGDQAFTRRDPHECWNPKSSCFFKALSDEFMFY